MFVVLLILLALAPACRSHNKIETGQPLETPDVYTSKNGTLHLRVKAVETTSRISHRDYKHMFVYETRLVDGLGTHTRGNASSYVAPEWHVMPGDRLIIDYINDLPDQSFTPIGESKSRHYPQPLNLHTHGLTVRPTGNSDNVLLSIPQRRSNRFVIDIPKDQQSGLYWYHPHIHGLSDDQVYEGLAGHIVVGRPDGDYKEFDGLKSRSMMIRYNVAKPDPDNGELIDASPVDTKGTALPTRGEMVYTVNGLVAPRIPLSPADPARKIAPESQVWAFTNITGSASYILSLDEVDATRAFDDNYVGRPQDMVIVSIDGTAMPAPRAITGDAAKRGYLLGQGGRVAILVQGPSDPSKVVRLVQVENRSGTGEASASDWANHNMVGGYRDYTRVVLAVSSGEPNDDAKHVDTPTRLTPNRPYETADLSKAEVTEKRTFIFNDVSQPTEHTPNAFGVDFKLFPDAPIAQPRVGTVEEWEILNFSSLHHPFHVHTQYNQVMRIDAPINPDYKDRPGQFPSLQYVTDMGQPDPAPHLQDVVNLPPALVGEDGMPVLGPDGRTPVEPGRVVLRMKIDDYLGTYVEHCHRLPHEDRGMMSMIRSIPNEPVVAVVNGSTVNVIRNSDSTVVASFVPFETSKAALATAVGDLDGDTVPDVSVASAVDVKTYSGASGYRRVIATSKLSMPVGSLALGDLNADGRDDVIAGQGSGGSRVVVLDGTNGKRLSDFKAYDRSIYAVSVAAGVVEVGGRVSLVTGSGRGGPARINFYNFDLFGDAEGNMPSRALRPLRVASVGVGDEEYRGGIAVATGYPFARQGRFAAIVATPLEGPVVVRTYTIGSHVHVVSASGVFLSDDYQPRGERMVHSGPTLDLEDALSAGARAAFVSTPHAADLVLAPANGGRLQRWTVDDAGEFTESPIPGEGTTIAGM